MKQVLLIVSGPSGCGKTTVCKRLLKRFSLHLRQSISATTRAPRKGEVDGKDYFFITSERYKQMVDQDLFLEHATFSDNSYGTPMPYVLESINMGYDVLFEIEWQGARLIKRNASLLKTDVSIVTVFLAPPSIADIELRLRKRGDNQEMIEKRLKTAKSELEHANEYDYIVVNDNFKNAVNDISSIYSAERMLASKEQKLQFVKKLCI